MKKVLYVLLAAVITLSMVLVECSETPAATTPAKAKPSPKPSAGKIALDPAYLDQINKQPLPKFFIATTNPGGQGERQVTLISSIIAKYSPLKGTVTLLSGGFESRIEPIRKGEVHWFPVSAASPMSAYNGETKGYKPLRLRQMFTRDCSVAGNIMAVWVLPNSNIKSGKDLAGKIIAYSPGHAWSLPLIHGILAANGSTAKDFTGVPIATYEMGFEQLVERRVDAITCITSSTTEQQALTNNVRMLPLTKKETDSIIKLSPYLNAGMTPENYLGSGKSVWGILNPDAFWVRPDVNEKSMLTFCDTLFSHLDEWYAGDPRNVMLKVETACSDCPWKVPFHAGSVIWFVQKGIWTQEHTENQKALLEQEKRQFGNIPAADVAIMKQLGVTIN